jgi:CheY-like chemotaxis protein
MGAIASKNPSRRSASSLISTYPYILICYSTALFSDCPPLGKPTSLTLQMLTIRSPAASAELTNPWFRQVTSPLSPQLVGRRILIVDDDRLNVRILSGILRDEGYELTDVDSGRASPWRVYPQVQPDLILMDVLMKGINGFETCRKIEGSTHGENAASVIFITAKSDSEDVVEGFRAGGVDYLPKPFRVQRGRWPGSACTCRIGC